MEDEVQLYLYDFYTKQQLCEIADHNNVKYKTTDRKLNIAKAPLSKPMVSSPSLKD